MLTCRILNLGEGAADCDLTLDSGREEADPSPADIEPQQPGESVGVSPVTGTTSSQTSKTSENTNRVV